MNCVSNVLVKMAKLLFLPIAVVLALVSFVGVLGGDDKNKHDDERKKEVNLHPDLIWHWLTPSHALIVGKAFF